MIAHDELVNFKRMWTWLSGYPAHDREYYMKYVVKRDQAWDNDCPLANSTKKDCSGCRMLWNSKDGSLCRDAESPLCRWETTSIDDPDNRSFYACRVAVLAMNAIRDMGNGVQTMRAGVSDAIDHSLPE